MTVLRSLAFNAAFYANLVLRMLVFSPVFFALPRERAWRVPKNWVRASHWLQAKIARTTFEIEGLENIPEGGYILAPKHQSFWDTYALLPWLDDPVYILKRELMWIPLFGWYIAKMRMIPVDRGARGRVMARVLDRAKEEMRKGRQLIIYPEGTRRPPGAEPEYKFGVARIYADLDVPVVPVAMHPGLFWPRRQFLRQPGHFKVRILPPIPPGLGREAFHTRLVEETEAASDALLIETVRDNPHLVLPESARSRLRTLHAPAEHPGGDADPPRPAPANGRGCA
ncbi:lysophospholipid acyltransferase family protein [Pararhizobium mangrovi]|uniref:1-acyl-sn-glycerol-3-phosphate acyltransferase n=1 Tax=Pararhizobium mangrovi TaxID=2590452 RepID=A0A506U426_9HYPH|nr:lysophospholipid acyltransferase family protein [Pararhizobium mangrovi]TPW27299.1 1-acyl-sn-glycerol-3-phosphate acyltransferase [Pararhizobium mangrovi]